MMPYRDWPVVLRRRWAITYTMGFLFLAAGIIAYLTLEDKILLVISLLLALCIALRCARMYRIIYTCSYEIVEGTCIEIGKAGINGQRKIRLQDDVGNLYAVLLDKRTVLHIGHYYLMYFEDHSEGQSEQNFFRPFAARQFLALEDLGPNHSEDVQPTQDEHDTE